MIRVCDHFVDERFMTQGGVVIDCGGRFGDFALTMSRIFNSVVHVFEPASQACREATRRVSAHAGSPIAIHRHAIVGRTRGSVVIGLNRRSPDASSLFEPADAADVVEEAVDAIGLADVLAQFNAIDYLKLDIEGAEFGAITTTPLDLLRRCTMIGVEFHDGNACFAPGQFSRADRMLAVERIRAAGFEKTDGDAWEALFVRAVPRCLGQ